MNSVNKKEHMHIYGVYMHASSAINAFDEAIYYRQVKTIHQQPNTSESRVTVR